MAATSDFDPRDKNDFERKAKAILNVLLERYKDRHNGAEEEKEAMDAKMKRLLFPAEGEADGKKKGTTRTRKRKRKKTTTT